MNWLVFHIASGHAFFTGLFFVAVAVLASSFSHPLTKRLTGLAFAVGVIAVAVSSAAIPYWCYAVGLVASLIWIASAFVERLRFWSRIAMAASCLLVLAFEFPYHLTSTLRPAPQRSITVLGDSITAGMGGQDTSQKWPALLAREHDLIVQDISHPGETAGSALRRAKSHDITSPVIILEIGGNDLLGSTTAVQFRQDLDALLAYLNAPGRQIIMFELPLPPFQHEFGRIQRSLAWKYNITLAPKRMLLSVIADEDSTVDTIHLTQAGHQRMADCVWRLVRSAFCRLGPLSRPNHDASRTGQWSHPTEVNSGSRQAICLSIERLK